MSKPTDNVIASGITSPEFRGDISVVPDSDNGTFVFTHNVGWGECDPAQIAYTANIPKWGLLAIEDWYRCRVGLDWYMLNLQIGIGTPFVSLNFEFVSPVKPPLPLMIEVKAVKAGNSSLTHVVEGYQEERLCFTGKTVAVFVNATTMKSISIPPNIRECIELNLTGPRDEHSTEQ